LELKKRGISTSQVVSLSLGVKAKGVSANANYGNEKSSSSETTTTDTLSNMDIKKREFYIGGEPPSEPSSLDEQGSTVSLREWGRSAFERPVPIQYQLQQIEDLFHKSHLPKVDDTEDQIAAKKGCMKKALQKYCSKIAVDRQDCITYEDGNGQPDAIRYGDFISIKRGSNNKYLTVPEDFPKFATGDDEQFMKVRKMSPFISEC
jgi:hypothetical protein